MRAAILLCLLTLGFNYDPPSATGGRKGCLSYDPAVVALTGRITKQTFPGPPNYESVRGGDAPEVSWVLHLARPVCVGRGQNEFDEPEADVADVQLVLEPAEYVRYRRLLGRAVVVRGKLFHAHTGHHHTKVLLDVTGIKSVGR